MRFVRPAVWLFVGAAACGLETVAHRQPEREANRLLVTLHAAGVDATKRRDPDARDLRFDVRVARADATRALAALERHNLPQADAPSSRDLVDDGSMIRSRHEERMREIVGLEGDVVNALRELPGVRQARAAISVPTHDPLAEPGRRDAPKASVLIVHEAGAGPRREDVQRFVQAKLPELTAADVDVVLVPAPRSADPAAAAASTCVQAHVVGFRVCAGDASRLRAVLASSLCVSLGLAGVAVWMAARSARSRRALRRAGGGG